MSIFFISDTHFGHAKFLTFLDADGEPIRRFASVQEMDEIMIERWNDRVRDGDRVYHLGDVAIGKGVAARILPRLRGAKRLQLGNHDDLGDLALAQHFSKIRLWRFFKDESFVISHMPLRDEGLRKAAFNVHGHIHEKASPTLRHINICVEQTNYAPISLDEIMVEIAKRKALLDDA